jgi:DNA-directed RNA polymerase subunit M/transcription elongation factor TFIIS
MSAPTVRDRREEALGTCPNCGATLPRANHIIEYETADRGMRTFAECRACDDVVHPS